MSKKLKWVIAILAVLFLVGAGGALYSLHSYLSDRREIAGRVTPELWMSEDGTLLLKWPVLGDEDLYYVEISKSVPETEEGGEEGDGEGESAEGEEDSVLFGEYVTDGVSCTLPGLPIGEELTLRIYPVKEYTSFGKERYWVEDAPVTRTFFCDSPVVTDLEWAADAASKTVSVNYGLAGGNFCRIYATENGTMRLLETVDGTKAELSFGEEEDLAVPEYSNPCTLSFSACRRMDGLVLYGVASEEITVTREDFLGRDLKVELTDVGSCVCTLEWNQTKGEYYIVQKKEESGDWETVKKIERDGELMYESSRLTPYTDYEFRVMAVGGQTMEDSEYAAVSDIYYYEPRSSPVYCTIWPVTVLRTYSDAEKSEVVGRTGDLTAYCVVEEKNGMFGIYVDGQLCYVDSNYCMINLPEFLGSLCNYDITNSYSSIFMVHDYAMPGMTDVVTTGYEYVQMEDGSFLVPLLYPTAKKLETAANTALEQGYRLKIYDSFRPHVASVEIYQLAGSMLYEQIPEKTFTGKVFDDLDIYVHVEEVSEEESGGTAGSGTGTGNGEAAGNGGTAGSGTGTGNGEAAGSGGTAGSGTGTGNGGTTETGAGTGSDGTAETGGSTGNGEDTGNDGTVENGDAAGNGGTPENGEAAETGGGTEVGVNAVGSSTVASVNASSGNSTVVGVSTRIGKDTLVGTGTAAGGISGTGNGTENGAGTENSGRQRITYWQLMTGGYSFSLGSFLNSGVSRHNLGVAMDLTLEYVDTGEELQMQTSMHDLSHFSATSQNNGNANLLASIMKPAGYNGISSEWWHFQDDEAKNDLGLPTIYNGVTPECWMTDGFGWKYRKIDGTYAVNCTMEIDGTEYTFDEDGYRQ